jgi:hypothetical protein
MILKFLSFFIFKKMKKSMGWRELTNIAPASYYSGAPAVSGGHDVALAGTWATLTPYAPYFLSTGDI